MKSSAVSSRIRPNTTVIRKTSLVGPSSFDAYKTAITVSYTHKRVKGIASDAFRPYIRCGVPSTPLNGLCNPVPELVLRLTQTLLDILAFLCRLLFRFFKSGLPSFLCFIHVTFQVVGRITSLGPSPAQPSPSRALRCIYFLI